MLRSADMVYVNLAVPDEEVGNAIRVVASQFGRLHVVDISRDTAEARARAKRTKMKVATLQHMERKLDAYEALMREHGVEVPHLEATPDFTPIDCEPGQNRNLAEEMKQFFRGGRHAGLDERDLDTHQGAIKELRAQIDKAEETIAVLEFARRSPGVFLRAGGGGYQSGPLPSSSSEKKKVKGAGDIELGETKKQRGLRAGYKVLWGTVPSYLKPSFKRTLARVSRFNAIPCFAADEVMLQQGKCSTDKVSKVPFYVVTVGRFLTEAFTERLATYMDINLVEVPGESREAIEAGLQDARVQMQETQLILRRTEAALRRSLRKFARFETPDGVPGSFFSPVSTWRAALRQERAILNTALKARFGLSLAEIEGWVPAQDKDEFVRVVESELAGRSNVSVRAYSGRPSSSSSKPPTYFPTNSFTGQFQSIVDTYGIAGYKEINPGLFTIVTFPFLFGVMYGDIGHGLFMAAFGIFLVANGEVNEELSRKRQLGEMMEMMHGARFVMLLMGLFGVYCGTIYNDLFSIPVNAFGSRYDKKGFWDSDSEDPYPYGVDPTWYGANNQLMFFNSLKMKLSVILGVTQMTFGIFLGSLNHVYENDYLGLVFEWIPRMLFMCCTFGYMIGIIIYKWTIDWSHSEKAPPNLIQTMIKMFLSPGDVDPSMELYEGQAKVQLYLILVALASVPTMLLAKPLISRFCRAPRHGGGDNEGYTELQQVASEESGLLRKKQKGYGSVSEDADEKKVVVHHAGEGDDEHDEHSFSDVMIHQGIHTIEFVLGCVSNTASYLRLWALSLAHAELSEVFWSKLIVGIGLGGGFGPAGVVVGFGAWFIATFAVLLCMDSMECVLHALRLHWVEFQNKFYRADGYKFEALDFKSAKFILGD